MKEMFLSFELSKKLKAKGFTCKYPFAMYDKYGQFCPLFTSADEYVDGMGFRQREVFNFDNFFEKDVIAPTIEQALKWLREEKNFEVVASFSYGKKEWGYQVGDMNLWHDSILAYDYSYPTYEKAAIAGIEYVLDNLI